MGITDKNGIQFDLSENATVLIVDDNPANLGVVEEYLNEHEFDSYIATSGTIALKRVKHIRPDIILLDIQMPGIDGFETCLKLKADEETADIPVIFMTALSDTDDIVRGFSVGAVDYVTKPVLKEVLLSRVISHLKIYRHQEHLEKEVQKRTMALKRRMADLEYEMAERKRVQEEMYRSEEKYRSIFENTLEGIYQSTPEDRIISANPAMAKILKYDTADELMDTITDLGSQLYVNPLDREELLRQLWEKGEMKRFEVQFLCKDQSTIWVDLTARAVYDSNGRIFQIDGLMADISAQKEAESEKARLEEKLRQAQKMEALGTLTSGIAHDFNNLLQVMYGHAQMLLMKKDETDPDYKYLNNVYLAASQASELVKRLLTLSRKAEIKVQELDLNWVIQNTFKLLERTTPKMVAMKSSLAPELSIIRADSLQMEQVIMNLAVNAIDAMDGMGKLFIETENFTADRKIRNKYPELQSGEYVLLKVTDTGCGIDEKTRERIFEPFFTTKAPGKGTGLGLSTAYGIIKGHGGSISCCSDVGVGTTFKIFLPVKHFEKESIIEEPEVEDGVRGGKETILLVDDEEMILNLSEATLVHHGYTVLTVDTAEGAIDIYNQEKERIHLIIMDLGMPGMGGEKGLEALRKIRSQVKVIVVSGYSSHKIAKNPTQYGARGFLTKPFKLDTLLRTVRSALDQT